MFDRPETFETPEKRETERVLPRDNDLLRPLRGRLVEEARIATTVEGERTRRRVRERPRDWDREREKERERMGMVVRYHRGARHAPLFIQKKRPVAQPPSQTL